MPGAWLNVGPGYGLASRDGAWDASLATLRDDFGLDAGDCVAVLRDADLELVGDGEAVGEVAGAGDRIVIARGRAYPVVLDQRRLWDLLGATAEDSKRGLGRHLGVDLGDLSRGDEWDDPFHVEEGLASSTCGIVMGRTHGRATTPHRRACARAYPRGRALSVS